MDAEMNKEEMFDKMVEDEFNRLLETYLASPHRRKVEIITKAFNFAKHAHKGVRRLSGEPYIMHPIAVAQIVCGDIGLGSTSICGALLHDVVELAPGCFGFVQCHCAGGNGMDFFLKCLVAVIFAAIVTIIYIGFRFKKIGGISAGVFSVVALLHDLCMVYGCFVICRFDINANFMAVLLTILGLA